MLICGGANVSQMVVIYFPRCLSVNRANISANIPFSFLRALTIRVWDRILIPFKESCPFLERVHSYNRDYAVRQVFVY